MSDATDVLPEPDRVEGAPHPRHTANLYGQDVAEQAFLESYGAGRLHHAWMITGPRGVGKATLAWRIARFLLANNETSGLFGAPTSLDVASSEGDPLQRRITALSEPRVALLRRTWNDKTKKLRSEITVEEVRKLKSAFTFAAADGGRRVAIVDAMDEMNVAAQNAFLKLLEEPPEAVTMLLIAHQPGRLLPTIRSRCRELRCTPLGPSALNAALAQNGFELANSAALAELSGGSVGAAVGLQSLGGVELYATLVALMGTAPGIDRAAALRFAEAVSGRGKEETYALAITLIATLLHRLARAGAQQDTLTEAAPEEAHLLRRLSPDLAAAQSWAALAQAQSARIAHARGVNLDPSGILLDTVMAFDATARSIRR